jgi:hypothetical protein
LTSNGPEPLADDVVLLEQLLGERLAELLLRPRAGAERQVAHVLHAGADHDVMDAGGDQRGAEVDGLLRRAALAVDGRRGGLDRQPLLQPRVARDVERLLAELLDAAGDHVLDFGGVDSAAGEDLGVALAEQLVGMDVLVVALLEMAAPNRGTNGLDDDDLTTLLPAHAPGAPLSYGDPN